MSGHLTDAIDPLAYAARGRTVEGRLALASLGRLRPMILDTEGDVVFRLEFVRAEGGIPTIQGMVECDLVLECQRCMEKMDFHVAAKVRLAMATSQERVEQLPNQYDPLLLSGEEISIASIVEDELILALPAVAMHEIKDCPAGGKFLAAQRSAEDEAGNKTPSGRKNPFAALAQLKDELAADASNTDEE